jgi:hypothetical protein
MLVFLICQSGLVGQQCELLGDESDRRVALSRAGRESPQKQGW